MNYFESESVVQEMLKDFPTFSLMANLFSKAEPIGPVKQKKKNQRKIVIIFLSISLNMCLGAQKHRLIETGFF